MIFKSIIGKGWEKNEEQNALKKPQNKPTIQTLMLFYSALFLKILWNHKMFSHKKKNRSSVWLPLNNRRYLKICFSKLVKLLWGKFWKHKYHSMKCQMASPTATILTLHGKKTLPLVPPAFVHSFKEVFPSLGEARYLLIWTWEHS